MKLADLMIILKQSGFETAYHHFCKPPVPPFIAVIGRNSENFSADNIPFYQFQNYDIELYTELKNIEAEKKIEDILLTNRIYWEKSENYIESENLFQISYSIQI